MGYVAYLSAKENIERISPEPPVKILFTELEKHFSREEIEYYYFARACYQWGRKNKKDGFEKYIQGFLDSDKKKSDWSDFDFSLENMERVQKKIFNTQFNIDDMGFFKNIVDPTKTTAVTNRISRFEDEGFRDQYILSQIEKYWNQGKSIFIIYGSSHAEMHEPVLQTLNYG